MMIKTTIMMTPSPPTEHTAIMIIVIELGDGVVEVVPTVEALVAPTGCGVVAVSLVVHGFGVVTTSVRVGDVVAAVVATKEKAKDNGG